MQTSLQGIASKAKREKKYRFKNLSSLLSKDYLKECWKSINRKASYGIDKVSTCEFEKNLDENISKIVEDLKNNRYHAKLVKRVNIPKGDGKTRPLGIPTVSDKLVQLAVSNIVQAIYEADFLNCSYGYRPNRGAKDGAKALDVELHRGKYNYVVDADIKGFFNNIDHNWLIRMLELRIDDRRFIRLIKKWLKAGIFEDGTVSYPEYGTPQGGIISPILANIYLHFVIDLWFEKRVKPYCKGQAYVVRYADDFVCAFQYEPDARAFYGSLDKRLNKFNLSLSPEKTDIIPFSKFSKIKLSFDFLGFEYRWGKSRNGKDMIKRRTSRKKLRKSLKEFAKWCDKSVRQKYKDLFKELNRKLEGYYNYYGVIGNMPSLKSYLHNALKILYKKLNRRSQRKSLTLSRFFKLVKQYKVKQPKIIEKWKTANNAQLLLFEIF